MKRSPNLARTQSYLVMMDTILDTRLGVVSTMSTGHAVELAKSPMYRERHIDQFSKIIPEFDDTEFNSRYKKRDNDVLRNSASTAFFMKILSDIIGVTEDTRNNPVSSGVSLTINTYPYTMDEYEVNQLVEQIYEVISLEVPIYVINHPTSEMTPGWLEGKYNVFCIYDPAEWIGYHNQSLLNNPIPSVICIAPTKLIEIPKEIPEVDPFYGLEKVWTEYLTLSWVPLGMMSLINR